MKLSAEQHRAVVCTDRVIKVRAGAGAGKTTMLKGFARARPKARILYISFNKAIAEESTQSFPANTKCMTTNGLAFAHVGRNYKHKLGDLRPTMVMEALAGHGVVMPKDTFIKHSAMVIKGLNRFFHSGAPAITERILDRDQPSVVPPHELIEHMLFIWAQACDTQVTAVRMPHSGYLKLFQLGMPKLPYDVILLDEAQDTNPCVYELIKNQRHAQIVAVGDRNQSIYGFIEAMDVTEVMPGTLLPLTTSYRYGQPIADLGNLIISIMKNDDFRLKGLGQSVISTKIDPTMNTFYLSRTNADLFQLGVQFLEEKVPFYLVGGADGYNFDSMNDLIMLQNGNQKSSKDPLIRAMDSFESLEKYAENVSDVEIRSKIKTVKAYGQNIPELVKQITAWSKEHQDKCLIGITNAHRAKGLEADQIVIMDNFKPLMDEKGIYPLTAARIPASSRDKPLDAEEVNLMYVAVTRAIKRLVINDDIKKLIKWAGREAERQAGATA
jgi:superfamily I DNA/RNA helicase